MRNLIGSDKLELMVVRSMRCRTRVDKLTGEELGFDYVGKQQV